jgi:transposase InsO family protein
MTGCQEALTSLNESVRGAVRFGDGSTVDIHGIGAVAIAGREQEHRVLIEVYYIPSLKCNIVSLGQLEEAGFRVEIDDGVMLVYERCQAAHKQRGVLIRAERRNRLYAIEVQLASPVCLLSKMEETAWLWHARYRHLNFRSLHDLGSKAMVEGLPRIAGVEQVCDGCALSKQHRAPFPWALAYRAKEGLDLVHADLCGQITPPTPSGKLFFLLIVDDYSRYMWLELLASKDEAFVHFKKIKAATEVESGCRLKSFRTDRGGEFNSGIFVTFCNEHGIRHNTTTPYTPQQNGVVERRNQSIVEMARCMLKTMQVPARF